MERQEQNNVLLSREELTKLMNQSSSLISLEEKLKESGYNFTTYCDYVGFLNQEWWRISQPRVNSVLESPVKEKAELPTIRVEVEGVEYLIHGIVHGGRRGWNPRNRVKNFVKRTINSFHDPQNKEDCLYEQNLWRIFDLSKSHELKDMDNTKRNRNSLIEKIGWATLSEAGRAISSFILWVEYFHSKIIKHPRDITQSIVSLTTKALIDERYQLKFADFLEALEMPQPFSLEKWYLSEKDSLRQAMAVGRDIATSGERSLWTAKELKDYANKHELKKLHYLGGVVHQTEIVYFLKHPDYSFEKLEEYRLKKKK